MKPTKRALLSVSDKTGIVEFAQTLTSLGWEILSTGGTAATLTASGLSVVDVSSYTEFPELMDGRLKTLHPKVHGGLLARTGVDDEAINAHGITPIDLVAVNLYPFEQTVSGDCTLQEAIENIDIGGPAMLRAAAKNHARVTVVVEPDDYERVAQALKGDNGTSDTLRYELACKVYAHTARYDGAIANYLSALSPTGERRPFADVMTLQFDKALDMRYGENPHQRAAFYRERTPAEACVATAQQRQGKALSYNNVADTDAALECVKSFTEPACVIVKHANPCGVAVAADVLAAYNNAYKTDPTSAFGGIIAFNRELDGATAKEIIARQFVEVIIAPSISTEALTALRAKENVRVLETGVWAAERPAELDFKRVCGGALVQDRDLGTITRSDLKVVTKRAPSEQEFADLLFAWKVVKFVKSNAIVYCRDLATVGIGAGQMSRVYSARIAAIKAADEALEVRGAVLASDAFFPFRDGIDAAAEVGVTAVIEPGGSMRDQDVIDAANEHGLSMVFTNMRHFRH